MKYSSQEQLADDNRHVSPPVFNQIHRYISLLLTLLFAVVVARSAWLADDALITLRTVRNFLDGFGPVWNVGERVQAYTHPLWMFLLTGAVALTQEYYYTVLLLSISLALVALYILLRYLAVDWVSALVGGAILILSKANIDYATSGLENSLTHLILVLFLVVYLTKEPSLRTFGWLALLAALGATTRLDSMVIYVPLLVYAFWQVRANWLRAVGILILGFIPLIVWELFAIIYYGFPFPNTMYAKLFAGIPTGEMVQQGLLYLLDSLNFEPLIAAIILVGMSIPWLRRDWRLAAIAVGISLNLIYLVRIGGDFMYGRFLTSALICATVIIVRQPMGHLPRPVLAVILLIVIGLGFANPERSPWIRSANYVYLEVDDKGIADERGHYHRNYGLVNSNRYNRLAISGQITGNAEPALYVHGNMGRLGYAASPNTVIVDLLALTDPLLARLPAFYNPAWRPGHLDRMLPDGYLGTLRTGQNRITDVDLARYYDQLKLVTSGPLFDPARWQAIWQINAGQLTPTRDLATYVYPDRATKAWADFDRTWPETVATAADPERTLYRGASFGAQGVTVDLGERQHASLIDLGVDADAFDLIFLDDASEIGRASSTHVPLQLGDQRFTVVAVPPEVAARGYTGIVVAPRLAGSYRLTRVALLDPAQWGASPPHAADLLRLAYFAFYRMTGAPRAELLASVIAAAEQASADEWQAVPPQFTVDLLKMPDPELQALVLSRAAPNQVLVDDQDRPLLRYLGQRGEALPADATEPGVHIRHYFEVLSPLSEEYTLWFHAQNRESDAEFMLYDWPLPTDASTWSTGMIAEVPVFLALDPGEYDLTAGLWTPEARRRLYADRANDVYWLDLGVHVAEPPAPSSGATP